MIFDLRNKTPIKHRSNTVKTPNTKIDNEKMRKKKQLLRKFDKMHSAFIESASNNDLIRRRIVLN